jgi:AcrR family transcriptional regulator
MPTRISSQAPRGPTGAKPPEPARRSPRQERARQTVEAIFEAAARILEREGLEAANTNHIAEQAGISIGTLYQYFSGKDDIFIAMARRELERDREAMQRAVADAPDPSVRGLARASVRTLIARHRDRHAVRRQVMRIHHAHGLDGEHVVSVEDIAGRIGARRRSAERPGISAAEALRLFVVTRSILGTVRAATLEQPALLDLPEFEEELVELAVRYLGEPAGSASQEQN